MRLLAACLLATACAPEAMDKLGTLPVREEARVALTRLRWQRLHDGDKLQAGDVVLCGTRDRVAIGFSRKLVIDYLGRDSDWLLPELFSVEREQEVLLAVSPKQLMRLELPRGIGSEARHPDGWVREVAGYPLVTSDLRAVERLFGGQELFALGDEDEEKKPPPPSHSTKPANEWRLGVRVFPRMGPRTGVVISAVLDGTPAEKVGLAKGDRIVAFAGQPVTNFRELQRALANATEQVVTVRMVKKGEREEMDVRIDLGS